MSGDPLTEIMNSLERRLDRRARRMRDFEQSVVRLQHVGADVPAVLRDNYRDAVARYDEARLAYNAALTVCR